VRLRGATRDSLQHLSCSRRADRRGRKQSQSNHRHKVNRNARSNARRTGSTSLWASGYSGASPWRNRIRVGRCTRWLRLNPPKGIRPAYTLSLMVFQSYALYPHMSVRENLQFV